MHKNFICGICYEKKSFALHLTNCTHHLCSSCWTSIYIRTSTDVPRCPFCRKEQEPNIYLEIKKKYYQSDMAQKVILFILMWYLWMILSSNEIQKILTLSDT